MIARGPASSGSYRTSSRHSRARMPTPIPIGSWVTEATEGPAVMTPPLRRRSVSSAGVTSSAEDQQFTSVDIGGVSLRKHDALASRPARFAATLPTIATLWFLRAGRGPSDLVDLRTTMRVGPLYQPRESS